MSRLIGKLREFDAYSKPIEDFRIKTLSGGAVTLASAVIMIFLFLGELKDFWSVELKEELFVDTSRSHDRVKINFDLTFMKLACEFLTVDAMDVSGEQQADVHHNVYKKSLDSFGNELQTDAVKHEIIKENPAVAALATTTMAPCGSCFGAETAHRKCCNTCDEVREAYRQRGWAMIQLEKIPQCQGEAWKDKLEQFKDQGCRIFGYIEVAKVAGNFHIAPGSILKERHAHVHDLHATNPSEFNTSHKINHFSFGVDYPGKAYPLDGVEVISTNGGVMFQYFVKVVPTTYLRLNEQESVLTHQFSVTKHQKPINPGSDSGLPGFFVMYEFSPIMVRLSEKSKSLVHFLTSLCAIIGGLFTVSMLLDSCLFHSSRAWSRKMDINKLH